MIVDVCLIGHEWLALQRLLHRLDALFVLLESKEGDTLLVKDLGIVTVVFSCFF